MAKAVRSRKGILPVWRRPPTPYDVTNLRNFPLEELREAKLREAAENDAEGDERAKRYAVLLRREAKALKPMRIPKLTRLTPAKQQEIIRLLEKRSDYRRDIMPSMELGNHLISQVISDELKLKGRERRQFQLFLGKRHFTGGRQLWSPVETNSLEEGLKYVKLVGKQRATSVLRKADLLLDAFAMDSKQHVAYLG